MELASQIRQVATAVSRSPLEALLYNLYYFRQLELGRPGPWLLPFLYQEQSPIAQVVLWETFEQQRDNIREHFQSGIDAGEIRNFDAVAAVPALSIYSTHALGSVGFADEVAELFLTGIAAR